MTIELVPDFGSSCKVDSRAHWYGVPTKQGCVSDPNSRFARLTRAATAPPRRCLWGLFGRTRASDFSRVSADRSFAALGASPGSASRWLLIPPQASRLRGGRAS